MKILVVSQEFTRGGLETQIKTYYENLPSDAQMVFAFSNYSGEISLENAKIYTGFNFKFDCTVKELCEDVERLVEIIKEEEIDVIHVHPFYSFFASLFASQITKTKLIYTFHGKGSFNFLNTPNAASIFKYAFEGGAVAQLHSVSDFGIKCFEELGYKNAILMPNPIDTKKFKTVEYVNNKKWAVVSRIDNDKLPEIKLFIKNKAEFGIEKVDVYGAGGAVDELIEFINDNGLSDSVCFKGYCTNLFEMLNGNYNGLAGIGRVVLEGLAMGLPVFFIGYGKLTGFVNKALFDEILALNFTNNSINTTNFVFPSNEEIADLQQTVINKLSINTIMANYIENLKNAESIFCENLVSLYCEIKALARNPDTANIFFTTHRDVYRHVHNFVRGHSVSNYLNNMFVAADFAYQRYDELNSVDEILINKIELLKAQNAQLEGKLADANQRIDALTFAEEQRTKREQEALQRKNMRLHRRVIRKIKRILKIQG